MPVRLLLNRPTSWFQVDTKRINSAISEVHLVFGKTVRVFAQHVGQLINILNLPMFALQIELDVAEMRGYAFPQTSERDFLQFV